MAVSKRLGVAIGVVLVVAGCRGTGPAARESTAYVSTDRPFSEPIIKEYEKRSRVRVNVVYDTEETKSTGLASRLLAEKNRPQADVFWSNEPVRTLVLKARGVLAPYQSASAAGVPATFKDPEGYWTGFSARLRVIVYNTEKVTPTEAAGTDRGDQGAGLIAVAARRCFNAL
jgi:iron(III) transport system substrate-binding protein